MLSLRGFALQADACTVLRAIMVGISYGMARSFYGFICLLSSA